MLDTWSLVSSGTAVADRTNEPGRSISRFDEFPLAHVFKMCCTNLRHLQTFQCFPHQPSPWISTVVSQLCGECCFSVKMHWTNLLDTPDLNYPVAVEGRFLSSRWRIDLLLKFYLWIKIWTRLLWVCWWHDGFQWRQYVQWAIVFGWSKSTNLRLINKWCDDNSINMKLTGESLIAWYRFKNKVAVLVGSSSAMVAISLAFSQAATKPW